MPLGLPSEAAGPLFLSIILAVASLFAWRLRGHATDMTRLVPAALLALGLQALHAAEEFSTGFHVRAPALWSLPPWAPSFFVWINLGAIALWCLCLAGLSSGRVRYPALAFLWFLALASIGNGIWHPLIALATGGYFPGLITSLAMTATGALLLRRLTERPSAAA